MSEQKTVHARELLTSSERIGLRVAVDSRLKKRERELGTKYIVGGLVECIIDGVLNHYIPTINPNYPLVNTVVGKAMREELATESAERTLIANAYDRVMAELGCSARAYRGRQARYTEDSERAPALAKLKEWAKPTSGGAA